MKKVPKSMMGLFLAIGAAFAAFATEMDNQKKEKKMEEMEERITNLEKKGSK